MKETFFASSESEEDEIKIKALPADIIWRKRVIRCKMVSESWMNDNGLNNVIDLIKRQKWEKFFKRRELVHADDVKEFYARLTMSHNRKKDVAKSSVRGIEIKFDHMKLASILGIPGNNGICEYIKEIWEESKYTKPLEITRRFANDETIMNAIPDEIMKDHELPYGDWLTMVFEEFGVPLVDKQGEEPKRRRDDEVVAPAEEKEEEEEVQNDYDWEDVIDEAAFLDAQVDVEEPVTEAPEVSTFPASPRDSTTQQKEPKTARVDPSGPSGHIPESVMVKLQAEFERTRANRIQADLEKAQAENARLLALLQQAKHPPKP
ncbi:hypothetical protein Dimus_031923 [Dionaea muscipula]